MIRFFTPLLALFFFAAPTSAQTPSALGVELETPLSIAIDTLEARGCQGMKSNDLQDIYYVEECELNGLLVTLAASMERNENRAQAPVREITFSAYEGDVGPNRVVEQRDKYVDRWTNKLGMVDPDESADILKTWMWESDSLFARIDYQTTTNGEPNTTEITLQKP